MPNIADSICRKIGGILRWPALQAITLHCGTKSARIVPPFTLTDPYTQFLPKTQPYLNSMTRTPKSEHYNFTLPKYTLSQNIAGSCRLSYYFAEVQPFLILFSNNQHFYLAELYQSLTHCWKNPILIQC